jgi:hypothetical protein
MQKYVDPPQSKKLSTPLPHPIDDLLNMRLSCTDPSNETVNTYNTSTMSVVMVLNLQRLIELYRVS